MPVSNQQSHCTPLPQRHPAGGLILSVATTNPAVIPKSGPEIKNHCSYGTVSWQSLAAILKLTPSNQESLHVRGLKCAKTCCDSQIHPLKSRITAAIRLFSIFPYSDSQIDPLKSRITAARGSYTGKTQHRFPTITP